MSTNRFNMQTALLCAQASTLAYTQPPDLISDGIRTAAKFIEGERFNIIAFRGTQAPIDFVTDAKAWPKEDKLFGRVHCGFDEAIESVLEPIAARVELMPKDKPLIITGHSLGGALAVLCAFHLGDRVDSIYTFGQPRVGNREFAKRSDSIFKGRHFRFVNAQDIVPRLPGVLAGYWHSGDLMFLPSTGGFAPNPPLIRMAISDALGFWSDWNKKASISLLADHHMERYVEKINRLAIVNTLTLFP
jgi:hypothetical protein